MNTVSDCSNENSATVILTGSTGSLGSYLLNSLMNQRRVRKIYCLNRSEDGQAKQKAISGSRGLATNWTDQSVEFLHVDLSRTGFGLSQRKFGQLLEEATHIIHNQWPVNFNWDLASFEPHIRGVRHLLDFCTDSPRGVEFLFVSTIGTVSYVPTSEPVVERPNHLLSPRLGGYSASKLICELIIEDHVQSTGQRKASICRVGQIAGPILEHGGMWNKQEWLPTMIASSKHIGLLPSSLGAMDRIDWIPVDLLSEIILELSGVVRSLTSRKDAPSCMPKFMKKSAHEGTVSIYHAVNPHAIKWAELVPTVASLVGIDSGHIVSFDQWVEALRLSEQGSDLKSNPGLKLLDFFQSLQLGGNDKKHDNRMMPLLATELSAIRSKTLASLSPVTAEWMALWLKQLGLQSDFLVPVQCR